MKYIIRYSCWSHKGKCRIINQDNYICDGKIMKPDDDSLSFPLEGCFLNKTQTLMGVFDGMGGEKNGEIASLIAAQTASEASIGVKTSEDLSQFCQEANSRICDYALKNNINSMGTTAAILAFSKKHIVLCNIGDTKIFRLSERVIKQISVDHIAIAAHGIKPPLSQNLGILPSEMIIEPYLATGKYIEGDIYLICSDGLTDMVSVDAIKEILNKIPFEKAAEELINNALQNGGKDNITVILCRIERNKNKNLLFY